MLCILSMLYMRPSLTCPNADLSDKYTQLMKEFDFLNLPFIFLKIKIKDILYTKAMPEKDAGE